MFIFIFDGFDEIDEDIVADVEESLRDLYKKNEKNSFIISIRPDPKLNASVGLGIYHVQPLSKRQVISLIDKVSYDPDQKAEFKRQLQESLYDDHRDFASSPLLVTMMLLTFHHFAIIPEKIYIFYERVFEVLYSRHDITKEGYYVRDLKTSLPIDDFSSILEMFSFGSYLRGDYDFTSTSVLKYSQQAINYASLEVDKRDFVSDMLKCVCLFIREGTKVKFTHRSFQEYFTALFIIKMTDENFQKFSFSIMKRVANDNVLYLLFAMQKERFEKLVILKLIERILGALESTPDGDVGVIKYFINDLIYLRGSEELLTGMEHAHLHYGWFEDDPEDELLFDPTANCQILAFILKCYPAEFDWAVELAGRENVGSDMVFLIPILIAKNVKTRLGKNSAHSMDEVLKEFLGNLGRPDFSKNLVGSISSIKAEIDTRNELKTKSVDSLLDGLEFEQPF